MTAKKHKGTFWGEESILSSDSVLVTGCIVKCVC